MDERKTDPTLVQEAGTTQEPNPVAAGNEGPSSLGKILERVKLRLGADDFRYADEDSNDKRLRKLHEFLAIAGARYWDARLSSYKITRPEQRQVMDQIETYCATIEDRVAKGQGVVLFGPSGTGKDHLLIGLARKAIQRDITVSFCNLQDLFADMRTAIGSDKPEDTVVKIAVKPYVLILSDLVPTQGQLTDFQANALYRIVDARYRASKATWCSLNVASKAEAESKLGVAVIDRLTDGALCLLCNWPSYRKPAK